MGQRKFDKKIAKPVLFSFIADFLKLPLFNILRKKVYLKVFSITLGALKPALSLGLGQRKKRNGSEKKEEWVREKRGMGQRKKRNGSEKKEEWVREKSSLIFLKLPLLSNILCTYKSN